MADVAGLALSAADKEMLSHPLLGGVILFARNFESPMQLAALTAEIRALRDPALLIAVDHEGGRVQRFHQGFSRIPPMRSLGQRWLDDPESAGAISRALGTIIAAELQAHGVDFSFTPVLDVDFGSSSVIGDRAFSDQPAVVAGLAGALIAGMAEGGMAAVGKHFPGHGWVKADSHVDVPVDERELAAIESSDLVPYRRLIPAGLAGIMPAHVVYPKVDSRPAGFSPVWLKDILRRGLGFEGMIFSDDLSMEGASSAGGVVERARAALGAGCDMALVCNAPQAVAELLQGLEAGPLDPGRAERMRGKPHSERLSSDRIYAAAVETFRIDTLQPVRRG